MFLDILLGDIFIIAGAQLMLYSVCLFCECLLLDHHWLCQKIIVSVSIKVKSACLQALYFRYVLNLPIIIQSMYMCVTQNSCRFLRQLLFYRKMLDFYWTFNIFSNRENTIGEKAWCSATKLLANNFCADVNPDEFKH